MINLENFNSQDFYNYLRDKGFTDNGANEVVNRICNDLYDREDLYQFRSFQESNNF